MYLNASGEKLQENTQTKCLFICSNNQGRPINLEPHRTELDEVLGRPHCLSKTLQSTSAVDNYSRVRALYRLVFGHEAYETYVRTSDVRYTHIAYKINLTL